MIDKIKELVMMHILNIAITSITVLILLVARQIAPLLLPAILEGLPNKIILSLLAISFLINLILVTFLAYSSYTKRFQLKFGIYWDKNKEPYCPICKSPLSNYDYYEDIGHGFHCFKDKERIALQDQNGKNISLQDALKILNS